MKIAKREGHYLIVKDDGTNVILTASETDLLVNHVRKDNLRCLIDGQVDEAEADWLDLSKYEGTREEFIDEIFSELEDEIDYGNSVDTETVDDHIADLARFYGLEKEE